MSDYEWATGGATTIRPGMIWPVGAVTTDMAPITSIPPELQNASTPQTSSASTLLPVGTPVLLREGSEYIQQSQGSPGIILSMWETDYCYKIQWTNGHVNSYRKCDIITISPDEYEKYKATAYKRIEEEIIERKKIEIKYSSIIRITKQLDKFFINELEEYYSADYDKPFTYLLGQNKDNIITTAILLRGYGGCKDMQHITTSTLTLAYIQINKKGLTVAGICRVGHFNNDNTFGADQIQKLAGNDNNILLSINEKSKWGWRYIISGNFRGSVKQKYEIVQIKRKGKEVKTNGNSEKKKDQGNAR